MDEDLKRGILDTAKAWCKEEQFRYECNKNCWEYYLCDCNVKTYVAENDLEEEFYKYLKEDKNIKDEGHYE